MKPFRSFILLSVGSVALFLCSVAARADSIPTLTATSVTYIGGDLLSSAQALNQWTISGNSFSLSGSAQPFTTGAATPGQSLADNYSLPVAFGAPYGYVSDGTFGNVTLDGVTHYVELIGEEPVFVFPSNSIYDPYVAPYAPLTVAYAPALVLGNPNNSEPNQLLEDFCPGGVFGQPTCFGNVIANVEINVAGLATLYGYQDGTTSDPFDTITNVSFATVPEPVSFELAAAGMIVVLGRMAFRRRKTTPHDKIKHDLRRAAGISL